MNTVRLFSLLLLLGCSCSSNRESDNGMYIAFTGATIIDGNGGTPIQNGVLLLKEGRVLALGTREKVEVPKNTIITDVTGKTIMPGIINAHGHVGDVKGIEGGHYSRENVIANLAIYARYGITTVVSLGGDKEVAVSLRASLDTVSAQRSRLFIAGEVITGNTPEEAMAVIEANHTMGVDFMKIRVDDNLGNTSKMSEEVYRAVIDRSHQLGYKIATHMYYLDDARKLLEAGTDLVAHSVRDLPVDDAFVQLMKEKNVGYCPTLTRELSTFVYGDTAEFLTLPFFTQEYDVETTRPLLDPKRQQEVRNNRSAQIYKQQLPVALRNLKTLSDEGVPIVFGTDSGVPTRFIGYFEHLEMEMMADAGLSSMQIIVSATKNAAAYMALKDLGTLSPGNWGDFLVLEANPLDDIRNVRDISNVFIGGIEVKR